MRIATRTKAALASALLAGSLIVAAPPAQAATCTTVPVSTPGSTVRLAGQDYRIPAISNVSICAEGGSPAPVWVETSGGNCTLGCLSIGVSGTGSASGTVWISYQADGSTVTHAVGTGPVGGPGGGCLLSVGAPQAPYPTCPFAVSVDDPVGDVIPDPPAACETFPPQNDPWTGESVEFCDDPAQWLSLFVERTCERFCDGEELQWRVCIALSRFGLCEP